MLAFYSPFLCSYFAAFSQLKTRNVVETKTKQKYQFIFQFKICSFTCPISLLENASFIVFVWRSQNKQFIARNMKSLRNGGLRQVRMTCWLSLACRHDCRLANYSKSPISLCHHLNHPLFLYFNISTSSEKKRRVVAARIWK